jgi:predicted dehydrogenase
VNSTQKITIIGSGDMGRTHAAAWEKIPGIKIVAVCDPDVRRAETLASELDVPAFADYRDTIAASGPDIVSVCVPVNLHRPVAEYAMDRGAHVFIEKPIAGSMADARAIQQKAAATRRKVVVGYQYRGYPGWLKLRELLSDRLPTDRLFLRFFDIREVRPKIAMHHKSMNGGPVIDVAGHFFDMARLLFRAEPVSVYARGHIYGATRPRLSSVLDPAIDTAEIIVEYEGGHTLSAYVNWGMPESVREIIRAELIGPGFHADVWHKDVTLTTEEGRFEFPAERELDGPLCRMKDLLEAIRGDTDPEVSAEEACRALAVSLAALQSIETGQSVRVEEILQSAKI